MIKGLMHWKTQSYFKTGNRKEHLPHHAKNTELFAYHKGRIVLILNGAKTQQLDTLSAKYSIVNGVK